MKIDWNIFVGIIVGLTINVYCLPLWGHGSGKVFGEISSAIAETFHPTNVDLVKEIKCDIENKLYPRDQIHDLLVKTHKWGKIKVCKKHWLEFEEDKSSK